MNYSLTTTTLRFQWLPLSLLIFFTSVSSLSPEAISRRRYINKVPRPNVYRKTIRRDIYDAVLASDSQDFKKFFYNQTLDHFNYRPESYVTFQQKYVINSDYWGGGNSSAPLFVYLGAESALDGDLSVVGFLSDNAARFKALLVYIEHRFYGESIPLGTMDKAMANENIRGCFSSAQAIADYAEVIMHVKKTMSAEYSPVIVVGGSYGGSELL
ncbi:lysosomal Pro-Xaa carboxypeptidase [Sarracenia purpurea var. burkii]